MSSRFPGSVVLLQEAIGVSCHQISVLQPTRKEPKLTRCSRMQHVVIEQGASFCYFGHVQAYLQGVVPPPNITCPQQFVPFIDGPV